MSGTGGYGIYLAYGCSDNVFTSCTGLAADTGNGWGITHGSNNNELDTCKGAAGTTGAGIRLNLFTARNTFRACTATGNVTSGSGYGVRDTAGRENVAYDLVATGDAG